MTGMKLGLAVLAVAVLAGVDQVQRSVDSYVYSSPRVLYIMAQYKIATGDAGAALRLVNKAKGSHVTCPENNPAHQAAVQKSCKYGVRG